MALTLYLTFSRGSLAGVVIGLGLMAVLRYRKLAWVILAMAVLMLVLPQTQVYVQHLIEGARGEDLRAVPEGLSARGYITPGGRFQVLDHEQAGLEFREHPAAVSDAVVHVRQ